MTTTVQATQTTAPSGPAVSVAPVLVVTVIGWLLNLLLEVAEARLLPHMREHLFFNAVAVSVWSLAGLAIGLGLLRLGRSDRRRTAVTWAAAGLALLTAAPLFWSAIPASLAGAAFALARSRSGSLAAARVVAVVAFVSFLAVSIGMFPFMEV